MSSQPKTILITGCSAHGIGAALALVLARQGHHIFATARSTSKILESLVSLSNVHVLPLDVTDPTSIAAAVRVVTDHGHGLDVLVNNAGMGYTIPLLDVNLDHAKHVYEANIWGPLRLVQGFADLLVRAKGRVINISSMGAALNMPWIDARYYLWGWGEKGIYSSSKAAIVQLSETLRLELAPLGVDVVVLPPTSRYAAIREIISNWATGRAIPKGASAEEFAESIVDNVLGSSGGLVWKGPNSLAVRFVSQWCPAWLLDRMVSKGQGLDKLAKSLREN
ncbi:SDR family oxidoreductase [Aspergillus tanneri]|uniref:NADPH-dependent 1-acyldihydroxyacetone phosphate reductase n=1 Tax=Aspergillus tanneri TaxID=1220188 RepID=A0A5M9M424_9EURO|nr:uncharacterized protein ATNIH1004_010674 [Aspergillus tanneri]KAA8641735.1 hypothetical protein ATNIH1004_010674 [Aspergillus tanneri]